MVSENIPVSGGKKFMPMIMGIIGLIGAINVLGLIPYVSTPTSQIIITMGLSTAIMVGVTIIGFRDKGWDNLGQFMPMGSPMAMGPFMVLVETVSYLSRAISLGVRLAANITAGHLLYAIISGFAVEM